MDNIAERIAGAASSAELAELTTELLGKKSDLSARKQQLGKLSPEERKVEGQKLNEEREAIERLLADRRRALADAERTARYEAERLDLTVRQHANHKTRELAGMPGFERQLDACSLCGATKKVIRHKGR